MERLDKAQLIVDSALDRKAEGLVALDVREIASFTDTFVFATGGSDRQVRAITDAITEAMREAGDPVLGVEGYREGRWVLIDANDAIVHVFTPDGREHYGLERLWSDAPEIPLRVEAAERANS
ncbi:MAG: ribosome silencing factor [Deltaproteobacteria bacterium]|nr:ribosome silencing factor [Deltaproteobacteria bacterium]MBW2448111.1 ribosome silencing factor [Deltaproteobacteria bacterium]